MKKETKKAPTIRFRGFTDDWKQRKLEDIVDKAVDNRGKTPPISEEGIHPLIEVASLGNGAPDYTKVTKYLDDETFESALRDYIKEGDILFSTVGSIGLVSLMDSREDAAIAQNIVAFRAKENNDSKFIYAMLSTEENQYKAWRIVMGAIQPSIKVSQLIHVEYCVSQNLEEQRKIGEYFTNLDHLITLHQRKLDQLKTLKKYFLQNMLPAKGEKVPRIRFKGFTGDWEQRRFGELVEFYNGDRSSRYPNDSDMVSEGIPFINAGDLVSGRVKLDTANKITEEKFNELSGAKIQRGDIIYCLRGTLGKNAFVDNFDVGTVASSLVDIRPKKVVGKYLYQVLNSDIEYTQRIVNDEGAAQPNLSAKNLSLFNIPMPDEVEQEKITAYFDDLDNLITLHQRKLNQLQTMKKFMLQNLFI